MAPFAKLKPFHRTTLMPLNSTILDICHVVRIKTDRKPHNCTFYRDFSIKFEVSVTSKTNTSLQKLGTLLSLWRVFFLYSAI